MNQYGKETGRHKAYNKAAAAVIVTVCQATARAHSHTYVCEHIMADR